MSIDRALERVETVLEISQRSRKAIDLLHEEIKKLEAVVSAAWAVLATSRSGLDEGWEELSVLAAALGALDS